MSAKNAKWRFLAAVGPKVVQDNSASREVPSWIFGSGARGTHRPDSNLDVAVEHGVAPGDPNVLPTVLWKPLMWRSRLQPRELQLDFSHTFLATRPQSKASLSSKLNYERAGRLNAGLRQSERARTGAENNQPRGMQRARSA